MSPIRHQPTITNLPEPDHANFLALTTKDKDAQGEILLGPSLKTDIEQTLEVLINSDPLIPCYKVNHPNVIEYTAFSQLPQQTQENITQGLKSLAEGNRISWEDYKQQHISMAD